MAEGPQRPATEVEEIVEAAQQRRRGRRRSFRLIAKRKLRRAIMENAALKFVAFVLALTVFILVHSDEDVYTPVSVSVSYQYPEDRVLVSEHPEQVRITVKGSRRKIRRFNESDIDGIEVDLANHRRSEYVFQDDLVQLPEGLELVRFTPPSFLTRFEEKVSKQVSIHVQSIEVPPGYRKTEVTTDPPRARISGPKTAVQATNAIRTREISLVGRAESFGESFQEEVELVPPEDLVNIVEPESGKVTVEVTLVEEKATRRLGPVPVEVRTVGGAPAEEFEAHPTDVTVILHGSRLGVDAVKRDDLKPYVEIAPEEVSTSGSRDARVVVPKPASGIGVEVLPEEVTVSPR